MRIKETEVVELRIPFDKACVYYVSDRSSWLTNNARFIANNDEYVGNSVCGRGDDYFAKFRVTEERDMTPGEKIAYHMLKAVEACDSFGTSCPSECPLSGCMECPLNCDELEGVLEKYMGSKEVIE